MVTHYDSLIEVIKSSQDAIDQIKIFAKKGQIVCAVDVKDRGAPLGANRIWQISSSK